MCATAQIDIINLLNSKLVKMECSIAVCVKLRFVCTLGMLGDVHFHYFLFRCSTDPAIIVPDYQSATLSNSLRHIKRR